MWTLEKQLELQSDFVTDLISGFITFISSHCLVSRVILYFHILKIFNIIKMQIIFQYTHIAQLIIFRYCLFVVLTS